MPTITKVLTELIKDRIILADGPMYFRIGGKSGFDVTRQASAHSTWTKVKAWAESIDAEATLLGDGFAAYYASGSNQRMGTRHLLVEITDPAAQIIEKLLQLK